MMLKAFGSGGHWPGLSVSPLMAAPCLRNLHCSCSRWVHEVRSNQLDTELRSNCPGSRDILAFRRSCRNNQHYKSTLLPRLIRLHSWGSLQHVL